ncbi:hypothetical protein [Telluribacter sp.]|uniref:hypothetical protein n=1 Tax=Telluribacter sp. TaxID=1978767 RepID=UPI002E0F1F63|nr:hypothetical protein [Telluribacter sp.]
MKSGIQTIEKTRLALQWLPLVLFGTIARFPGPANLAQSTSILLPALYQVGVAGFSLNRSS